VEVEPRAFETLLAFLDPDRERAGHKYEQIRGKLLRFFESRGCRAAEEYADEAIDRVARRITEGERISQDASRYFYGVARNLMKEYWGARRRERALYASLPPVEGGSGGGRRLDGGGSDVEESERLECLERCLQGLPVDSGALLRLYYRGEKGEKIENRRRLAHDLGIPPNALRIRVYRLRTWLEACVEDCLVKRSTIRHGSAPSATPREGGG
jgi:DNA-directed RNA polymerase specialized sigma24 family protein